MNLADPFLKSSNPNFQDILGQTVRIALMLHQALKGASGLAFCFQSWMFQMFWKGPLVGVDSGNKRHPILSGPQEMIFRDMLVLNVEIVWLPGLKT